MYGIGVYIVPDEIRDFSYTVAALAATYLMEDMPKVSGNWAMHTEFDYDNDTGMVMLTNSCEYHGTQVDYQARSPKHDYFDWYDAADDCYDRALAETESYLSNDKVDDIVSSFDYDLDF